MIDTDEIERRLTDALEADAASLPDSSPAAFSWQGGRRRHRATRRIALRRNALTASGFVAAATVAAVLATMTTGGTAGVRPGTSSTRASGVTAGVQAASSSPTRANHSQPSGSAPALLLTAADMKLRTGDAPLAAGQYRYVRTISAAQSMTDPSGSVVTPPAGSYTLDELWIPKDPNGVWMRRLSFPGDPSAIGATTWQGRCDDLYANTEDGTKGDPCTRTGTFDTPTPAFIAALPRQASALYSLIRAWAQGRLNPGKIHDVNFEMFSTIGDLLTGGVITSDLTSTLYTVLSRIPGIRVVAGAKNYSGIADTGFRLSTVLGSGADTMPDTKTIIVDVPTGAYLGDSEVNPYTTYLDAVSTGVADKLGVDGH